MASEREDQTKHIFQSLAVNVAIALAKGVAAFFTGSGAMLAETIHSSADCANQLLLLVGVKRAAQPPSPSHPLGYGRAVYFWSFIVALLLFTGGGVFSIWEGVHKLLHPEAVEHAWVGLGILLFSICLEGWATLGNLEELEARRGATPLFRYLKETKDSDLVVVFGENAAAVLGLTFAIAALLLSWRTGDGRWDAAGGLCIGAVLVAVALFLAVEVKSLLIGERADHSIEQALREVAKAHAEVEAVLNVITIQQGPGEALVAAKLKLTGALTANGVAELINTLERELKAKAPAVRWCFIEPYVAA